VSHLLKSTSPLDSVREIVATLGDALVAYSGGIDSALVLAVAAERTGAQTVALTAVSPSLARHELEAARTFARGLGVRHLLVDSRELDDPAYAANPTNRCYFCKRELYARCEATAANLGFSCVLDGFNADDASDHRPGRQAAVERGIRSPLAEAGLSKADVRDAAHQLGLPIWDKPASPCLASRLPYGTPVTVERLAQVEAAEAALRSLGFRELRVRHFGEAARIEIAEAELPRLDAPGLRRQVEAAVKATGYLSVAVDPRPLRSGRLNEISLSPSGAGSRGNSSAGTQGEGWGEGARLVTLGTRQGPAS
jgi:uncharacterized protein